MKLYRLGCCYEDKSEIVAFSVKNKIELNLCLNYSAGFSHLSVN